MIYYALKEKRTGLFYSENLRDISELGPDTLLFKGAVAAIEYKHTPIVRDLSRPKWFTTLSAIERMYDKPILEIDEITDDMINDTASLFNFIIVPITIEEREI